MSWQKGDKISYFFALSFMSIQDRKYFKDLEIKNQSEADRMNLNYPKGKMALRFYEHRPHMLFGKMKTFE